MNKLNLQDNIWKLYYATPVLEQLIKNLLFIDGEKKKQNNVSYAYRLLKPVSLWIFIPVADNNKQKKIIHTHNVLIVIITKWKNERTYEKNTGESHEPQHIGVLLYGVWKWKW